LRIVVTLLVILAMVIGAGVWMVQALDKTADDLVKRIDQIEAQVRQEKWDEAERTLAGVRSRWAEMKRWWAVFLDHQEIDNIDFTLVRIGEYLWAEDEELALGEAAALKEMVRHIPEKEAVTLENIL